MTFDTVPGSHSTKSFIIETLSTEWPLSCRKIYNRLSHTHNLNITYQAVHKAVLQMLEQGILTKAGRDYSLNLDWVNKLGRFSKDVEDAYLGARHAFPQLKGDVAQMDFDKGYDAVKYLLETFMAGRFINLNSEKIAIVAKVQHMWNPFVLVPMDFGKMKEMAFKIDARIACRGDTQLDRVMARFYGVFNVKTAMGVEGPDTPEIIVIGDTVIQIFNPPEMRKKIADLYEKTKSLLSLEIVKTFSDVAFKEMKVTVLINRNPVAAKTIRDEVNSKFLAPKKPAKGKAARR